MKKPSLAGIEADLASARDRAEIKMGIKKAKKKPKMIVLPFIGETKVQWVDIVGVITVVVTVAAIVAMILLYSGSSDDDKTENMNAPPGSVHSIADLLGDRPLSAVQDGVVPVRRECFASEFSCRVPGDGKPSRCVGADGRPVDATVTTNDGAHYCCTFGCESQIPTYRTTCKANQTVCGADVKNQRVCVMDDNKVVLPGDMLFNGNACCNYSCFDPATLPVRACFNNEAICPGKSYCYDFSQNVVLPKAVDSHGNACCPQTGRKVCVSLDSAPRF